MAELTRPDWDTWFLRLAHVTAERASCRRKKVGAVIVRDRDKRVISGGYNGAPRGMPDCLEVGCEMRVIDGKESCVRTLHAESNALDLCGPLNEPHTLYCTVIPCRDCALRIIQSSFIKRVVYAEYYESRSSKDTAMLFLNASGLMLTGAGPRAELVKYDKPIVLAQPDFDLARAQSLAKSCLSGAKILTSDLPTTKRMLEEEIAELCVVLGVEL